MRWRCKREKELPDVPVKREEAKRAREESELTLSRLQGQWEEVHGVVHSLRELRRKNHFAEMIGQALAERPK